MFTPDGRSTDGAGAWPIPDRVVLDEGTTLALRHRPEIGAVVVEVSGLAAGEWADSLALELLALDPGLALVVDVCGATLVNASGLALVVDAVVAAGTDPHRVCLVCERISSVVLLRRSGATDHVALFGSVDDAVECRRRELAGVGPGWRPSVSA